jgi:N-acetyl-gamma-glutamyl-phosphate reductase
VTQREEVDMAKECKTIKAVIAGASGYTGAELLRLLLAHGGVEIMALSADRKAGQAIGAVFPHLAGISLPDLVPLNEVNWSGVDVVFCCLPHGTTHEMVSGLPDGIKIIDLSADFRLSDPQVYAEWYGRDHGALALQKKAVYGLSELFAEAISKADLVACPGCYPTSAQLPLSPLLESKLIESQGIVIDAKSGVSGAGRKAQESALFAEMGEGISAYGVASHRHTPEIEQGLSRVAGHPVRVTFTPHLAPMSRGILSTIYVSMASGIKASDLRDHLGAVYEAAPFVRILPEGEAPGTRLVRGSNHCLISVFADRQQGRAIIVSVIDNLVKGASGQAVQNMNLMFGFPETQGLEQTPLFP